MIFIDVKKFGSDDVINLMLDEASTVNDMLMKIAGESEKNISEYFILSVRNREFLSKMQSFKSQSIKGGDRLILIRRED